MPDIPPPTEADLTRDLAADFEGIQNIPSKWSHPAAIRRAAHAEARVKELEAELKRWRPLAPADAQRAFDEAEAVPLSDERIAEIVARATDPAELLDNDEQAQLAARLRKVEAERNALRAQLPEGMKHCTIVFKSCLLGHGWLTATNWVQHGCPTCALDAARAESAALRESLELIIKGCTDKLTELPVRVDRMSDREHEIFKVGAEAAGDRLFAARTAEAALASPGPGASLLARLHVLQAVADAARPFAGCTTYSAATVAKLDEALAAVDGLDKNNSESE